MKTNRSIPDCTAMAELPYSDIGAAIDWLCDAFGFSPRLRIGDHRAQINVAGCAVVLIEAHGGSERCSMLVRVDNVDDHHARAKQHGAEILRAPADHPYGERQYTALDLAGHAWTFSETIADVDPESWGGTLSRRGTPS